MEYSVLIGDPSFRDYLCKIRQDDEEKIADPKAGFQKY